MRACIEVNQLKKSVLMSVQTNLKKFKLLARPYYCLEEPHQKAKAKALLERALGKDQYYLPAVLMMVDMLQEQGNLAAASKMIKKQLTLQPDSKLYTMLGDIMRKEKDQPKAVENYTIAIK